MAEKFGKIDSDTESPVLKVFKPSLQSDSTASNTNSSSSDQPIPSTSTGITKSNQSNNQPNSTATKTNQQLQNDPIRKRKDNVHRGCISVNDRQRGNPLLKSLQINSYAFEKIVPDYILSSSCCALFLSLKYHNMYPNYIYDRMNQIGSKYGLKILLLLVDILDVNHSLKEMIKICSLADFSLMCAWSYEDAGKILDTYKCFEYKSPESIMDKKLSGKTTDYQCNLDALSSIKSISKTDSLSLLSTFKSLDEIIRSSKRQLEVCPGLGPSKAEALCKFFNKPFKR